MKNSRINEQDEKRHGKLTLKRKRMIAVVSLVITLAIMLWLGWYITRVIQHSMESDGGIRSAAENFREFIRGYGGLGWVVAFGIQILQVMIPTIPGEFIEVGMGLCFGWLGGALICLVGGAIGSALLMLLIKKYGTKVVELFVSVDRINEMRFINNEKKLKLTVFIFYLIPGTPKDALIFFFGLTRISIWDFLWIQTLARIPSIITSTVAGHLATNQQFTASVIIFAVTGVCALLGMLVYRKILSSKQSSEEKADK